MLTNLLSVSLIFFNQIIRFTNSNNITCLNDGLCRDEPIICNNNEDCHLKCDKTRSCYDSIVQCPINGKCNIFCGTNRNACDKIEINATHSTSLYLYCADNECDDATLYCPHNSDNTNDDHQCILSGIKTIDRITFYTQEGFNDINIQNIDLTESIVFCGSYNEQYKCNINTAETGCVTSGDQTCETYRLPTFSPTIEPTTPPTFVPSTSPTIAVIAEYQRLYHTTHNPTYKPTNAPIQIYNNEDKRLEFYIYYNDTNGINMILGKWMKEEFLNVYQQFSTLSSENTEWHNAGLMNMTFCAVFNIYSHNEENKYCQRFMEYGYYENDQRIDINRLPSSLNNPGQFNAEFVAYGTFGIYSDASINSFQLFLIDTFTSYLFKKTFNSNMNNHINTVGFDDTFEVVLILVEPFNAIKQNTINNTQKHGKSDENINIILGILMGILLASIIIICFYGIRFYFIAKQNKHKRKKYNAEGIEGKNEKENSDIHIHNNDINIIHDCAEFKLVPSIAPSSITTRTLDTNMQISNMNDDGNHGMIYLEDDKLMAPGYYLEKIQQGYLSTDNDSNDSNENDQKLQIISSHISHDNDDNPSSDSNDNKSVISSIISFRKRKKNKRKHRRAKTVEINIEKHKKKLKVYGPKKKRSFHWGFTDNGSDIRYKHGENEEIKNIDHKNTFTSDVQSVFTVNTPNTLPELQCGNSIQQLELARNSSYHSSNHNINNAQISSSFNSNNSINKSQISRRLTVDDIAHDENINDAQFLAALSPSVKSIEDMYASPINNSIEDDIILKKSLSPIKNVNQTNLGQQIEMNSLPQSTC